LCHAQIFIKTMPFCRFHLKNHYLAHFSVKPFFKSGFL